MLRLARCLFRIRNSLDLRIEKPLIKMSDLVEVSECMHIYLILVRQGQSPPFFMKCLWKMVSKHFSEFQKIRTTFNKIQYESCSQRSGRSGDWKELVR